jgi:hypothetical protein
LKGGVGFVGNLSYNKLKIMKGSIRRLFCWHDYKQVSQWEERRVFETGGERPIYRERIAVFKCEKCSRYKVVKLKT